MDVDVFVLRQGVKRADIGVGIGLLLLSGWVFWKSYEYRQTVIYIYGPNFFPQVLAVIMAICAFSLLVRAFMGKALSQKERIDRRGFYRMALSIVMCIVYLIVMQVIGFAMSTCLFLFLLMLFLGQKGVLVRCVSSITVALAVWAVFRFFLVIPIPTGIFSFTF